MCTVSQVNFTMYFNLARGTGQGIRCFLIIVSLTLNPGTILLLEELPLFDASLKNLDSSY